MLCGGLKPSLVAARKLRLPLKDMGNSISDWLIVCAYLSGWQRIASLNHGYNILSELNIHVESPIGAVCAVVMIMSLNQKNIINT